MPIFAAVFLLFVASINGADTGDGVCSSDITASQATPPFEVLQEHKDLIIDLHRQLDEINTLASDERSERCANARALVVSVGGYCKQKGFGGNMWGIGEALKFAYNTKRMVVFAEKEQWVYVDERDCPSQSWECYFEPIASCRESELNYPRRTWLSSTSHRADERVVHWDNCKFRQYEVDMVKADPGLASLFRVPAQFQALTSNMTGLNVGWYGAVIAYALRPKQFMLDRVEEVKARIHWNQRRRPMIGVHVRRGEKWTDCGQACMRRGIDLYMSAAKQWKEGHGKAEGEGGYTDVYVATDGDTVMGEMRNKYPEFNYFYNTQQCTPAPSPWYRDDTGEFEYILKTWKFPKKEYLHINRTDCMVNTLVDLLLLAQCDALIGTGMSNFSNMAYALLMATLGVPLAPPCALKTKFARPDQGGRTQAASSANSRDAGSLCVGPLQHAADGSDWSMLKGFG